MYKHTIYEYDERWLFDGSDTIFLMKMKNKQKKFKKQRTRIHINMK